MKKPYGRTAAKRRADVMKIDNITGAPAPGGQLVDYRPQEVSVSPAGKRGAGPLGGGNRKVNNVGKPVPTRRG